MDTRCNKKLLRYDGYLVGVGFAAFMFGCLFYALARHSPHIFLLSDLFTSIFSGQLFMSSWGALPSFFHTFSFVLISVGITGYQRFFMVMAITLMWVSIELLFELGQHPALKHIFIQVFPEWFERVPILNQIAPYFIHGTYDVNDVVAIFVAAGLAILMINVLHKKGECHEQEVTLCE